MIPAQDILLVEEHTRPLASFALTVPTGLLDDPPEKPGVAYLTAQMLSRGAGGLDYHAIADELDYLGSNFSVSVGRDTTTLYFDALVRNLDAAEALVATVLAEPTFPEEELARLKRQTAADLEQVKDHDPALGQQVFVRRLFPGHPYGRPLKGTLRSLEAVTRDDLVAFYRARYRRAGVLAGGAGDVDRARLVALVEATLGRLPDGGAPEAAVGDPPLPEGYRVTLVDKPDRSQTQVFVGQPTVHATHPDLLPLLVGQTLFGGTFTARLSHEIREKRGWSYGAYSYLQADRRLGTFMMRFYPGVKDTVAAMRVADELFAALVEEGPTEEEVEAAKSYLANGHPMGIETPEKELHERLGARLAGRPDDWTETFVQRVRAVTTAEVRDALRLHLSRERAVVTVVCTASELSEELRAWERVAALDVVDYRADLEEAG